MGKKLFTKTVLFRTVMVISDIIIFNFSYWFGLIARFFIGFQFRAGAEQFTESLLRICPFYTLAAVLIFLAFGIYKTLWRNAGVRDYNRILFANITTAVVFYAGAKLSGNSMPRSLYLIAPVIQLVLTLGTRVIYRVWKAEQASFRTRNQSGTVLVNTMLVGIGDTAYQVIRHIEQDENNLLSPVCIVDYRENALGGTVEGLPVISGIGAIADAVEKYQVKRVILAEASMPSVIRKNVRELCDELKIPVQDYVGFFREAWGSMTLADMVKFINCPVELIINGVHRFCDNGADAARYISDDHSIKSMYVRDDHLVLELQVFLTLMYITNDPAVAQVAEKNGVQRIWIDLETLGKQERQKNMNTVKSNHTIHDIENVAKVLTTSELLVRVNPINENSEDEINRVIAAGADMIMLPMWKSAEDVRTFLRFVGGRVKTTLLLETKEAVACVDEVLAMGGFDEIHIGLNDLHLSYGLTFMFELLKNGTVETLCRKIAAKGIPYGFGGIARIGEGTLPAEWIVKEHYRLNSTRAILSRSFCNTEIIKDIKTIELVFAENIAKLRESERSIIFTSDEEFTRNKAAISDCVDKIVKEIRAKRERSE